MQGARARILKKCPFHRSSLLFPCASDLRFIVPRSTFHVNRSTLNGFRRRNRMRIMKYILTACLCLLAAAETCALYDYESLYVSKGGVAPVQKRERSRERHFMIAASIESVHATSGAEIPMYGGTKYGAGIEIYFL